jgi:hypothetical protein
VGFPTLQVLARLRERESERHKRCQ